jgi:peroxiredoxin
MRFITLALLAGLAAGANAQGPLKVGDPAPEFSLPATTGKEVKLSDFRGKATVVLAFFPAAFTGGCTKEVAGYQEGLAKFAETGAQIFGVSTDNVPSLRKFAEEQKLSYPLLSDFVSRKVSQAYGVLNAERGLANRTTFVIDRDGRIQHVEQGSSAVDPNGALAACQRIRK